MDKPAQNIQDSFLNNARKDKSAITIYLLSGVKLTGRIRSFDKYSVVLETNNQEQLIFKHAISTLVTPRPAHRWNEPLTWRASPPPRGRRLSPALRSLRPARRGRRSAVPAQAAPRAGKYLRHNATAKSGRLETPALLAKEGARFPGWPRLPAEAQTLESVESGERPPHGAGEQPGSRR